jgi:hypothetical protein
MTDRAALLRRLAARRRMARAVMLFESAWPALLPALSIAGLFLIAALLGLPPLLPGVWHAAVLGVTGLALGVALVRGLMRVRLPDDGAADRRLEAQSGLRHRPLSVLNDRPAIGDAPAMAVWEQHLARTIQRIGRLRVGLPSPGMARRDPRALRLALVLGVVAALGIANTDAPARVTAALSPSMPVPPGPPPTELQAWVTPPAYTRLAPIFLKASGGPVSVPIGARLTVNVSGGTSPPALRLNDTDAPLPALDRSSFQIEQELTRGGTMQVRRDGAALATWALTVVADQAPTVAWGENPGRVPSGTQTRLPWQVADDYGVTALQAEIFLRDRPEAAPLVVTVPLPGGSLKSARGASQPDLTAHPWAGLPVAARLVARDAAGQTGTSEQAGFDLPERPFRNQIARILVEARKTLSQHPDDRGDALQALDGLMLHPEAFNDDLGALLNLDSIYYGLVRNKTDAAIPEAQDMLWQLALHMEEGQTEQTARSLEEARQAARDAMDKAQQEPSAQNREALAKKLEELRQAIERHMQALIQEAQKQDSLSPFDPKALQLTDRDLERMAKDAGEAAKEGRMADAQQQMQQLEKMLDRLRSARAQGGDKQNAAKRQRGRTQTGAVQDMIAREGGLLDHAQRRDSANPSSVDPGQERQADARVQQALRRALGELMQQFTDLTGEVSPGLGEADQAMRDSAARLSQGNDPAARQFQQQAIAALQKGNREMGQAMAKQFGSQPGEGEDGEDGDGEGSESAMGTMTPDGQRRDGRSAGPTPGSPGRADSGRRDPLGRAAQGAATDSADVTVPEERERQRTQAIQEELRRRGAEQERPRQELDYIDRLLKRF